ncbi:hypothetical protein CEUSTIGMA_g5921.t1 [Chlamydomonas eustigma]|uniref:Protein kinase domain-containing protein n=1 Tax=Chlamydomonas eustigma TaxID=1157962 RepID=A0A250X6G7_9CHLO|nr:hypothetical protein CEUSTIGMA_g5921.t1 [Chlamydomonas eustigma]|eukprot:GAX78482.1 hypothetical protein CEUSTIGMA_g5921.t1 [Chlamydomonas eustigma]
MQVPFPAGLLSPAAQDFISLCLDKDPINRPTVQELLQHPLLKVMKRNASFRCAARRSKSFVDFLAREKQEKDRAKMEKKKQGFLGTGAGKLDDEDLDEFERQTDETEDILTF